VGTQFDEFPLCWTKQKIKERKVYKQHEMPAKRIYHFVTECEVMLLSKFRNNIQNVTSVSYVFWASALFSEVKHFYSTKQYENL
jgi:hypothetical protein